MRQLVQLDEISKKCNIKKVKAEKVFTDSSDSSRIQSTWEIGSKRMVPKLQLSNDSRTSNTVSSMMMTTTRDSSSMTCISSRSALCGNSDSVTACEYVNSYRSSSMVNLNKQFVNNASTSEFTTYNNNYDYQKRNLKSTSHCYHQNPSGTSIPLKRDSNAFSTQPISTPKKVLS